jgi:hypothetical protein
MKYPCHLLTFANPAGLTLRRFNTLRLSRGWATKLKAGEIVLLAHKDQVLGQAKVSKVISGRITDMLYEHAWWNHVELALHEENPRGYETSLAMGRRRASLEKMYGPQRVTESSYLSVIGLEPMKR